MTKLLVFDLGNVILPFEHRQIATKLHAFSGFERSPGEIFQFLFDWEQGLVNDYEKGLMSTAEFFEAIREYTGAKISIDEFTLIWNDIFHEEPSMNELIGCLKGKGFPLFLLSNTSELHFRYIVDKYPIVGLFDELILSFEVGAKKPDERIYQAVMKRTNLPPEEILYIDDIEEFVEAARRLGMRGHVFKNTELLRDILKKEGI